MLDWLAELLSYNFIVRALIVGGLVSSTLLEFLVRPLVFFHFGRRAALQALEREAPAAP